MRESASGVASNLPLKQPSLASARSDVPEIIDKKTITALASLVERFEAAISREEIVAKNQEELAGVMLETFLDDDGSIKDITHSAEIISAIRQNQSAMDRYCERIETTQR